MLGASAQEEIVGQIEDEYDAPRNRRGSVLGRLGRAPKPGEAVQAGRVRIELTRASVPTAQELRVQEPSPQGRRIGR